ncbi:MAG: ATP-binding protein [Pseudanabaena sp. M135S2SP2A07QC]|uniref:AAA family ATPase n=1 Tax=Microcystis sp. M158S2 TaxID=2771152 RepID=UPI002586E7C4|nr:ATP-binding protein [Microcystis sp. M158S2]MCA6533871.1 ATP-binding protein [Pseudanabaena sp. M176S2SP2A07QC]MCA6550344.1 ATP-binding protein [Pseudanabaena sp. M152S2SP2A07QC]MCA6552124.1 ATP-binding protein [Pseudanabaena sp. M135S2SP2A07QC]MCA6565582.1 ATP-binding protein [Pseudanabaena sp. M151S2SP2A07QC]MCA6568559.1 ATP-binding protein [Pseudanabaena sp. M065S1SP2A07QC]MCA6577459.1 ATP-binding protein [Pseudanabaena sp. M085S1SP2A07QC]
MKKLHLENQTDHLERFKQIITGQASEQILLIQAPSGFGKSTLLTLFKRECQEKKFFVVPIPLKGADNGLPFLFDCVFQKLGQEHFPNFADKLEPIVGRGVNISKNWTFGRQQIEIALNVDDSTRKYHLMELQQAFFNDLSRISGRIVFLIDDFEFAPTEIQNWIESALLMATGRISHLSVVVAGQNIPDSNNVDWGDLSQCLKLKPAIEISHKYSSRFESIIAEKSENFIGRVYVFNAISQFINSRESGYFLLTGNPGMGKSAILAQWVKEHQCIAYFNVKKQTDKASQFIENIIEQLNLRYNIKADFNGNRNEFSSLLLSALKLASQKSEEKIVIVIDALDEVDPFSCQGANILFLSAPLPKNVFIIMSERRDTPFQLSGEELAHEILSLLDSKYEGDTNQDIRNYIKEKVNKRETLRKQIEIISTSIDEFIDVIAEKSEKNFLYLRHVLPDIEGGVYQNITKLDSIPKGLQKYYKAHWERMGMHDKSTPNRIIKLNVIYHLSESYRAISRELLSKYVEQPEIIVQDVIDEWIQFLHKLIIQEETCYKIYHQSFQDFLHEEETVKAIGSDLRKIKKRKADVLLEGIFDE